MKRNTTSVLPRQQLRLAALVLTLAAAPACHAYIDPNTGGFIYQLLFPLIVAVAAGWRWVKMGLASAWFRLIAKLTGRRPVAPADDVADKASGAPEDR